MISRSRSRRPFARTSVRSDLGARDRGRFAMSPALARSWPDARRPQFIALARQAEGQHAPTRARDRRNGVAAVRSRLCGTRRWHSHLRKAIAPERDRDVRVVRGWPRAFLSRANGPLQRHAGNGLARAGDLSRLRIACAVAAARVGCSGCERSDWPVLGDHVPGEVMLAELDALFAARLV